MSEFKYELEILSKNKFKDFDLKKFKSLEKIIFY